MLARYADALKECRAEPTNTAAWAAWAIGNQIFLEEEGVPAEWIEVLASTGLRPAWDVVTAYGGHTKSKPADAPPTEVINMNAIEEGDKIDAYIASKAAEELQEAIEKAEGVEHPNEDDLYDYESPDSPNALQTSLRKLYADVGIDSEDIFKIDTGCPLADSKLQTLPLDPPTLAKYHHLVAQSLLQMGVIGRSASDPGMMGDAGRRWERAEAGRAIRQQYLVDEILRVCDTFARSGGGVHHSLVVVMDRNHVDGVRRLWEARDN